MDDRRSNGTHRAVHAPTRIIVIPVNAHPAPAAETRLGDLAEAGERLRQMQRTLERRRRRESAVVWLLGLVLIGGAAYALIRWPWATLAAALVIYALISLHLRLKS